MNDTVGTTNACAKLSGLLSVFMAQVMHDDTDLLLRYVKRADLTLPLLAVLALVERQSPVSIGEIATSLDYSLANASLLVDKLVCQGCVTRVENANDRRHKLVQLTPKGQSLLCGLRTVRADHVAQQLRLLPPDLLTETIELFRAITDELPPEPQRASDMVGTGAE
ncbi:MAG TPA: MarR family winged helix-turn-helix transcriptional regulator [Herpetosiphonaceae bacterium]